MKHLKESWLPSDLYDSKTGRPIDTLYFTASIPLKKGDDASEENEGLVDEAGEQFTYILSHYVCFVLPGDAPDSYRLSRKKYKTKYETDQAALALQSIYASNAQVLNFMPIEETISRYIRFV